MNVFVAGGSGAIGIPLVRALVAARHQVTALTRSSSKRAELQALGASVAVADALDRDALIAAVVSAKPTHIVHQLTALPKGGPRRAADVDPTNRLRVDGTRNLLEAAVQAGARRFLVGSFALLAPRGPAAAGEDPAAAAVRSMEDQVLDATKRGLIEGAILRYGMFYGVDNPATMAMIEMVRKRRLPVVRGDSSRLPFISVEDAVSATVRALDAAPPASVYDIVDDHSASLTEVADTIAEFTGSPKPLRVPAWLPRLVAPYLARIMSIQMPLSNAKAKAELGWRPRYPTVRNGLAQMLAHAA
jgi:nucleoside-diphosphate-sugar epimerase